MGIPRDAVIESVGVSNGDVGEGDVPCKTRRIECANGHTIHVRFSVERDIDPMVRGLQTCTRDPLDR
jgi:hypothetical protein